VYKGFAQMSRAATIAGELDTLTKELIALAIGVVHGCDGCIASHARAEAEAGASKQQAAEAIGCDLSDARRSGHHLRRTRLHRVLRVSRRRERLGTPQATGVVSREAEYPTGHGITAIANAAAPDPD